MNLQPTARRAIQTLGLTAALIALPAAACDQVKQQDTGLNATKATNAVPAQTLATLPIGQQIALQGNAALVQIVDNIELAPIPLALPVFAAGDETFAGAVADQSRGY